MADTGAPWNIPFAEPADLVRDWPALSEDVADAVAAGLSAASIVKQVVTASTSTQVVNSTSTYADTGLTATITPAATGNKVLVLVNQSVATPSTDYVSLQVVRGATVIHQPPADATGPYEFGSSAGASIYGRLTVALVDSPNAATATTYKTQFRRYDTGTAEVQTAGAGGGANGTSYIILVEVAA